MRKGLVVAAAFAATLTAGAAQAGPFINGSFEQPGGAPIRQQLGNNDGFVTGWTNNGGFQIYESSNQDGIAAGDGNYYISFGHNGATGGTLWQTFDTVAGTTYVIDYLLRQQQGADPSQTLIAEIIGGPSVTNTNMPTLAWGAGQTLTFVATTNINATLRFRDATPAGGGGGANFGLDGVTIRALATGGVPEPATWAFVILGFGALGAVMRRSNRQARIRFA
ncbi:MAG: PEPxxWA-CTERM sorting domain-containing protein [Proteobacteria bacterium]|nr:PEPxxWA-CTERM sorting domain-containing protein [Pseudomonadota bacterium]